MESWSGMSLWLLLSLIWVLSNMIAEYETEELCCDLWVSFSCSEWKNKNLVELPLSLAHN